MEERIRIEDIGRELRSLRSDVARATMGMEFFAAAKKHSDWSAHGNWSSSSKKIEGAFDLATKLGTPDRPEHLELLINEASSEKFISVAKNLSQIISEK